MRQSENRVKIEGILSEINLTEGSFTKENKEIPYIRGQIKVKVNFVHEGQNYDIDVPVDIFVSKWTNKGALNPAYKSVEDVKDNFVSIAAAGEEKADRVRITNAQLTESAYYSQSGELITTTKITASFINKIKKEDCKPEASFVTTLAVGSIVEELDSAGELTGSLLLKGVVIQYNDKADLITYKVKNPRAVEHISSNWSQGDTVRVTGIMNFSAKTIEQTEDNDFGDPVVTYHTINVKELVITGGASFGANGEMCYDADEIGKALAARKVRIEKSKEPKIPAQKTTTASTGFNDIDF